MDTYRIDELEMIFKSAVRIEFAQDGLTIVDAIARFAEALPEDHNWDGLRYQLAAWRSILENNADPTPFVNRYTDVMSALLEAVITEMRNR